MLRKLIGGMQQSIENMSDRVTPTGKLKKAYSIPASVKANLFRHIISYIIYALLFFGACYSYYLFLDKLYIVDEVCDADALKEYSISERFTIRVQAPETLNDLKSFVSAYSICQSVSEIQILWDNKYDPPTDEFYQYQKTHCRVSYIPLSGSGKLERLFPPKDVETQSKPFRVLIYVILFSFKSNS